MKIKNEIVCKYNKIKSGVDLVICYVSIENLCFIIWLIFLLETILLFKILAIYNINIKILEKNKNS